MPQYGCIPHAFDVERLNAGVSGVIPGIYKLQCLSFLFLAKKNPLFGWGRDPTWQDSQRPQTSPPLRRQEASESWHCRLPLPAHWPIQRLPGQFATRLLYRPGRPVAWRHLGAAMREKGFDLEAVFRASLFVADGYPPPPSWEWGDWRQKPVTLITPPPVRFCQCKQFLCFGPDFF